MGHFFDSKKTYAEKTQEINRNYKGDFAKQELAKLKKPNQFETQGFLRKLKDLAFAELDLEAAKLSEAIALSPDWKFLSLNVKLPPQMIQKIHDRNADDALLCLGLQQYCTNNGIDVITEGLDLRDYASVQRQILEDFFQSELNTLRREDGSEYQMAIEVGFYDNCKRGLEDYESYLTYARPKTPVVRIEEPTAPDVELQE